MLKNRLHAEKSENIDINAQNAEMLIYMLKGRNVHTYSNFMWLSYTELRKTAEQQTISEELCCMSDQFSEIVKYCFSIISGHLSWLIVSTVYCYNRN